jgi:hypothetical protein
LRKLHIILQIYGICLSCDATKLAEHMCAHLHLAKYNTPFGLIYKQRFVFQVHWIVDVSGPYYQIHQLFNEPKKRIFAYVYMRAEGVHMNFENMVLIDMFNRVTSSLSAWWWRCCFLILLSGLTYAKLSGVHKHALKTDIISFLEGCNLTLEDVKMDYTRNFYPIAM